MTDTFPASLLTRFAPERPLARGGFSAVWLARQQGLDRRVAVKILDPTLVSSPDQVERFVNEARLTASLKHPGVVTLLDHGVEKDLAWIAYELVDGPSLRDWVDNPRPWQKVLGMARQVAAALEHAHRHGAIHRDVKPDNILEAKDGTFKLADFGIAKWAASEVRTQSGLLLGTPAYMSPCQILGEPASAQFDLYSLGATLYELLAGHPPFTDPNPLRVLEHHVKTAPPPLRRSRPDVPISLERLVMRLLAKQTADRPASAAALEKELEQVLRAPTAKTVAIARPAGPAPARAFAAAGVAGVVALALAAYLLRPPPPRLPDPPPPASVRATPSAPARPANPDDWPELQTAARLHGEMNVSDVRKSKQRAGQAHALLSAARKVARLPLSPSIGPSLTKDQWLAIYRNMASSIDMLDGVFDQEVGFRTTVDEHLRMAADVQAWQAPPVIRELRDVLVAKVAKAVHPDLASRNDGVLTALFAAIKVLDATRPKGPIGLHDKVRSELISRAIDKAQKRSYRQLLVDADPGYVKMARALVRSRRDEAENLLARCGPPHRHDRFCTEVLADVAWSLVRGCAWELPERQDYEGLAAVLPRILDHFADDGPAYRNMCELMKGDVSRFRSNMAAGGIDVAVLDRILAVK